MSLPALALPPSELEPNIQQFFQTHHRLPRLGDPISPLEYRGWLLPYVLEWHRRLPAVGDRWGYWLHVLERKRLPDGPIPQIHFRGTPDPRVMRALEKWIERISYQSSAWQAMGELITWLCWALGFGHERATLPMPLQEQFYREADLIYAGMLKEPYDYFGC